MNFQIHGQRSIALFVFTCKDFLTDSTNYELSDQMFDTDETIHKSKGKTIR